MQIQIAIPSPPQNPTPNLLIKLKLGLIGNGFVVDMDLVCSVRTKSKSASGAPGSKSAPRGSKSTTFAKGIFQLVNLQKIAMNPIGEPSVLPTQYPIYL